MPPGRREFPEPYWSAPGARLYLGDVRACLRQFPTRSVHCVVTSPPYWGLRDYGTAEWEGGDPSCDHGKRGTDSPKDPTSTLNGRATNQNHEIEAWSRGVCGKCGAVKVADKQLGAEPSPDCGTSGQAQCGACFVCNLVAVFREVHRVLRSDGTAWLNMGDTYSGSGNGSSNNENSVVVSDKQKSNAGSYRAGRACVPTGNLVGVPWRVALALQADGWVLRQDVIWYSPNKMPESVSSRCTKSHEHVFLLAKGSAYYFDATAIEEEGKGDHSAGKRNYRPGTSGNQRKDEGSVTDNGRDTKNKRDVWSADDEAALFQWLGANAPELLARFLKERGAKSDVWVVPTRGYPGAHYATFSPRLIEPCILAGTSEHGCCAGCGRPYERVVVKTEGRSVMDDGASGGTPAGQTPQSHHNGRKDRDRSFPSQRNGLPGSGSTLDGTVARRETAGWQKACGCPIDDVVPAVVLDPFVGSGTTVATAMMLGRAGIGIDLSETYLRDDAVPRIEAAARGGKVGRRPTVAIAADVPPPPRRLRQ